MKENPKHKNEITITDEKITKGTQIEAIENTMFSLVKMQGQKDWNLTIGQYVLAVGTKKDLKKKVEEKDWTILPGLVVALVKMMRKEEEGQTT